MITAWQTTLDDEIAPETLVRFGRVRSAITIAVIEDDRGLRVEARLGRRLVERIAVGHDRSRLGDAMQCAWDAAMRAGATT